MKARGSWISRLAGLGLLAVSTATPLGAAPWGSERESHQRLYDRSDALLIGVSDYTDGWEDLPSIPRELDDIQTALQAHDFQVWRLDDPTSAELNQALVDFVRERGIGSYNKRLLIFFAGHGETLELVDARTRGYIVPADAPLPSRDPEGFKRMAISMDTIEHLAGEIEAKHALFVFDSCFSGSLIKVRSSGARPPLHITSVTDRPVRQFITAGTDGQKVPGKSIFSPLFVRALAGGADRNDDGYVTGTELGSYLHEEVVDRSHNLQTPQRGKIRDVDLDEGDFVFAVGGGVPAPELGDLDYDAGSRRDDGRSTLTNLALGRPVAVDPESREAHAAHRRLGSEPRSAWQPGVEQLAVDGNPGTVWNAGRFPGRTRHGTLAPAWIEIDLGGPRQVSAVVLTPAYSSATKNAVHLVWGYLASGTRRFLGEIRGESRTAAPVEIAVEPHQGDGLVSVRVETQNVMSWEGETEWVAWYEIEVRGR